MLKIKDAKKLMAIKKSKLFPKISLSLKKKFIYQQTGLFWKFKFFIVIQTDLFKEK